LLFLYNDLIVYCSPAFSYQSIDTCQARSFRRYQPDLSTFLVDTLPCRQRLFQLRGSFVQAALWTTWTCKALANAIGTSIKPAHLIAFDRFLWFFYQHCVSSADAACERSSKGLMARVFESRHRYYA
jgi:hypothetical protein